MRAIIEKRFTLDRKHKQIVSVLEDTELDMMIAFLFHYYKQCRILLNDIDVTYSFSVWRDASLEIGQEIVIEVVPEWRLK